MTVTQKTGSTNFIRKARFGINYCTKLSHYQQQTFVDSLCQLAHCVDKKRNKMKTSHPLYIECEFWERNIDDILRSAVHPILHNEDADSMTVHHPVPDRCPFDTEDNKAPKQNETLTQHHYPIEHEYMSIFDAGENESVKLSRPHRKDPRNIGLGVGRSFEWLMYTADCLATKIYARGNSESYLSKQVTSMGVDLGTACILKIATEAFNRINEEDHEHGEDTASD